jgi:hypothetical protein
MRAAAAFLSTSLLALGGVASAVQASGCSTAPSVTYDGAADAADDGTTSEGLECVGGVWHGGPTPVCP